MKNHFPFRLGTTSYILNDELLANIHFLKDKVDHVELFVYDSGELSNGQTSHLVTELSTIADDHDLTYSIHLPIGLKLGSPDKIQREAGVETIIKAVDATRSLHPLVWDLHLEQNYQGEVPGQAWQEACILSLEELKIKGVDPSRTGIETLEFNYEPIIPILDQTDYAVTLDIGHVWFGSLNEDFYLEQLLPRAVSFHIHGFEGMHDHKGIHTIEKNRIKRFLEALYKQPNRERYPVAIEVFSRCCLEKSLGVLNLVNQMVITPTPSSN